MNKQKTKELIEVMQAYINGANIECRSRNWDDEWIFVVAPSWDFGGFEYRIKPEKPEILRLSYAPDKAFVELTAEVKERIKDLLP